MNPSPAALSRASAPSAVTRISSPSRNESSPKSSRPVSETAASMSWPCVTIVAAPPAARTNWRQYSVTIVSTSSTTAADGARRPYDSPVRRRQAAETSERIVAAGSELVHEFDSWHWDALTFRAVAERAGVGERTVYRHFPTERHLHDAVMARLEEEAGVTYEGLDLAALPRTTARVFSSRRSFAAREIEDQADALFVEVDQRRREALLNAVTEATPTWSDAERGTVAALLDVVWSMPAYERLVAAWDFDGDDATHAITWLMSLLTSAIDHDAPPPAPRARARGKGRTITG